MPELALTGARLLDGTGRPPVEPATVVVDGDSLEAAGPSAHVNIPDGCQAIDVAGGTVLPALIDGHMHVCGEPGRLDHLGHVCANLEGDGKLQECLQWGTGTIAHAAGSVESIVLRDLIHAGRLHGNAARRSCARQGVVGVRHGKQCDVARVGRRPRPGGRSYGAHSRRRGLSNSSRALIPGALLLTALTPAVNAAVIPYPHVPGDRPSASVLSVTVDGVPVDTVHTDMNVGYAHFAFTGTVTVELKVREPIQTFDLSPHRYGIEAQVRGNTLSFQLSRPRKLHLKVNSLPRFFVFADAPEIDPPQLGQPGVHSLVDFGVSSDLDRVQTAAIQRAMDDVAAKGGTLYVPPGLYRCGQLTTRSGLTLYLAPGAVLQGTGNVSDYPRGELGTQQLYLLDCENVTIKGRGVIDGQGRALRLGTENSSDGRMKLIRSLRASNCLVEGVILRDAGSWSIHLVESSDLRFTDYKLISNSAMDDPDFPWEPNTDGFDPDNSSRVLIENGFVSCHDDAIAVKLRYGTLRDMDDVQFRNNVVWTAKSALKIGTEVCNRRMTNVVFEGNDVVHADRGIAVYCYRGATIQAPKWLNNHFEFIGDNIKQMNMEIKVGDDGGKGHLNNVVVKDNTFERFSPNPSKLRGLDATHLIDGITFDNLMVAGEKRMTLQDAQIQVNQHVKGVAFR